MRKTSEESMAEVTAHYRLIKRSLVFPFKFPTLMMQVQQQQSKERVEVRHDDYIVVSGWFLLIKLRFEPNRRFNCFDHETTTITTNANENG